MITSFQGKPWIVLDTSSESAPDSSLHFGLLRALLEKGYPVKLGAPASQVARHEQPAAANSSPAKSLVLCFDDATAAAAQTGSATSRVMNVASMGVASIVESVESCWSEWSQGEKTRAWKPWFPVIDYDRCTNCMQCLSFCLFDVYGVDAEKQITVQNQDNCKTDCPACSRVCPEVAIMFPKYKAGPINGDAVSSEDVRREGMKVDISSLLGGDIYSMLRDRSAKAKSRFSAERDEDRALKERQRCLTKLKALMGDLDIPADLLTSLPSPEQIESKAEAARLKAQQAMADQTATAASAAHPNTNPKPNPE
jgi:NAD-dependent dihydropyrimidine dehydrogenase PreA subunit